MMLLSLMSLPLIVMMLAAVVPGIWLLCYIYRLDRLDKEPSGLLAKLFVLGIISTLCAVFTESAGVGIFSNILNTNSTLYKLIENYIVIALSEEGFKYMVLKRATWKNPNFNCSFDGVVYAVFVSLGFAVWENIKYVFNYGIGTAILRAFTAVPGHMCFGVLMGAFYALAKRRESIGDTEGTKFAKRLAVIVPVMAHGTYDLFAGMSSIIGSVAFIAVIAIIFGFCFKLVKGLSQSDEYIA